MQLQAASFQCKAGSIIHAVITLLLQQHGIQLGSCHRQCCSPGVVGGSPPLSRRSARGTQRLGVRERLPC